MLVGQIRISIALSALAIGGTATIASALDQQIRIESGIVAGVRDSAIGVVAFKGIPFTAPPVGNLRWRPPMAVAKWNGSRRADTFSAPCMQFVAGQSRVRSDAEFRELFLPLSLPPSEDCLYLNVWSAAATAAERRPVIVWIHGGGWIVGSPAVSGTDGAALARKGAVLVSINYRLGPFGFLSHPELTEESKQKSSGNYGILDQIAALQWVQTNIARFGGDPNIVTVVGQSAGALSASLLTATPLAKGLFHRVIAQSGSLTVRNPFVVDGRPLSQMEQIGTALAASLGVDSLAELRGKSKEEILKSGMALPSPAGPGFPPFGPSVDGWVLPKPVGQLLANGAGNTVSLLLGWNATDGEAIAPPGLTVEELRGLAAGPFGQDAGEFLKRYPAGTNEAARASALAFFTDYFAMEMRAWARIATERTSSQIWLYEFNRVPADAECRCSFHGAEIPFAFNNVQRSQRKYDDTDKQLAEAMSSYWINFARTGDPNGTGPAYLASVHCVH
jgi:para-nitrobenzyl esterase